MQVKQNGVTARRRADDALRQRVIGRSMYLTAGVGRCRQRRDQCGPQAFGQVDEGCHGRAHALVVAVCRIAIGGSERLQRRWNGREGIGLVVQPGN